MLGDAIRLKALRMLIVASAFWGLALACDRTVVEAWLRIWLRVSLAVSSAKSVSRIALSAALAFS